MQDGFENWKDKLEDSDAGNLVPGFDTQAAWKKLEPRIPKKQPIKWQLYAAAMIAGLLLGGTLMQLWNDSEQPQVAATNQPAQVIKETVTVYDTAYANTAPQPQTIATVKNKPRKHPQLPTIEQPAVTPTEEGQVLTIAQVEEPKQEIEVAAPKPKQRVLHLMDIENEDTKMVLSAPTAPQRPTVVSVLSSRLGGDADRKTANAAVLGISFK